MEEMMDQQATPWERRTEVGFFNAIVATVKEVLIEPHNYFAKYKVADSISTPYTFYLLIASVATVIGWAYGIVFTSLMDGESTIFVLILPLIVICFGIFIQSGLIYLFVKLFKGEGRYKETFHACAYGCGAAAVFSLIPFLGGLVSSVWAVVATIFGLMKVHKLDGLKASMAYFLPGLIIMAVVFAFAMFAAFAIGMMQAAK